MPGSDGDESAHGRDLRPRPRQPGERSSVSPAALDIAQLDIAQHDIAQHDIAQLDIAQLDIAQLDIAQLYITHRPLLFVIAARKFQVPDTDCEGLIHDAMLALLQQADRVDNPRAFLVGAICNASRAYLRARTRMDFVEGARLDAVAQAVVASEAGRIERELLVRQVLARLRPSQREVLRLHYYEHLTAREVAERLHVTHRYAEKRIVTALRQARIVYAELMARAGASPVARPQKQKPSTDIHAMNGSRSSGAAMVVANRTNQSH